MSPPSYENLELLVGEDGATTTAGAVVQEARQMVAAGQFREAFDLLMQLAVSAHEAGLAKAARDVLTDLRALVPGAELEPSDEAWMLNAEGLADQDLGRRDLAIAAFEEALSIGRQVDDRQVVATALQNLGTTALDRGEAETAQAFAAESLALKIEIEDYYGAAQLIINLIAAALELGDLAKAEDLLESAEPVIRASRSPALKSTFHGNRGQLAVRRGDYEEAEREFRKGLRYSRQSGEVGKELIALQNLAKVALDQGAVGRGLRRYRQALREALGAGSISRANILERSLAVTLHRAGRDREAAQHFEAAATRAREEGDRLGAAAAIADFGAVKMSLGETGQAQSALEDALRSFRELEDEGWQRSVLLNLAALEAGTGQAEQSVARLEEALTLVPADAPEDKANLLRQAAEVSLTQLGDEDRAAAFLERELSELQGLTPSQYGWTAATAGALLSQQGSPAHSIAFFDVAAQSGEDLEDDQLVFHSRNDRAVALSELGEVRKARRDLERCLDLAGRLGDRAMEAQASGNLGELERRDGNLDEAVRYLRRGIEAAVDLGDESSEAATLANLGLALTDAGDYAAAKETLDAARSAALRADDSRSAANASSGRGELALREGRFAEAVDLFRRAARERRRLRPDRQLVETLGGLVEALAALVRTRALQRPVQELVAAAQRTGEETRAARHLEASAFRYYEHGRVDEAADLLEIALVLVIASDKAASPLENSATFLAAAFQRAIIVNPDLVEDLFEKLIERVEERHEGLGVSVGRVVEIIRETINDRTET